MTRGAAADKIWAGGDQVIDAAMTAAIQAGLDPEILMACNESEEELTQEAR